MSKYDWKPSTDPLADIRKMLKLEKPKEPPVYVMTPREHEFLCRLREAGAAFQRFGKLLAESKRRDRE